MTDSVFTKIIKREIPAEILYENDTHIVILSIAPHNPGHSLVIPKSQQYADFWSMDEDAYSELSLLAQKIAKVIYNQLQPKRVGLVFEGFGVSDHVHINLIPINKPGDLDHTSATDATPDELAEVAQVLRSAINKGIN